MYNVQQTIDKARALINELIKQNPGLTYKTDILFADDIKQHSYERERVTPCDNRIVVLRQEYKYEYRPMPYRIGFTYYADIMLDQTTGELKLNTGDTHVTEYFGDVRNIVEEQFIHYELDDITAKMHKTVEKARKKKSISVLDKSLMRRKPYLFEQESHEDLNFASKQFNFIFNQLKTIDIK